jgi:hypothetical protein
MKRLIKILTIPFLLLIGFGLFYLYEKQHDNPFDIEYTSPWRLKLLGYEDIMFDQESDIFNLIAKRPSKKGIIGLQKSYSGTIVYFTYVSNKCLKSMDIPIRSSRNETYKTVLDRLRQSPNLIIDTLKLSVIFISSEQDSTFYNYSPSNSENLFLAETQLYPR